MSIVDRIIDLNTVALMGGTVIERFYVTPFELDQIFSAGVRRPSQSELERMGGYKPGLKGYIDGVAVFVKEPEYFRYTVDEGALRERGNLWKA